MLGDPPGLAHLPDHFYSVERRLETKIKYLCQIITIRHGDVWDETRCCDDTEKGFTHGLEATVNSFELQRIQLLISKHDSAPGSQGLRVTSHFHVPRPPLKHIDKIHYRIAFKKHGTTIDLIRSFTEVMMILIETVNGLQLLRKLGWLHRDVSIGSIFSFEGKAKLADLEYAKKVGRTKSYSMQIGAIHFISVEVAAQMFLFRAIQPFSYTEMRAQLIQKDPRTSSHSAMPNSQFAEVPFVHSHLHDLESLWWVAVWVVFYNHFCDSHPSKEEPLLDFQEVDRQLAYTRTLFPSHIDSFHRRNSFQISFTQVCDGLPNNKKSVCSWLDVLRRSLIYRYSKVESTLPLFIDLAASEDDIYEEFKEVLTILRENYVDFILTFIPDIHAQLRNLKRPRTKSTNDKGWAEEKVIE